MSFPPPRSAILLLACAALAGCDGEGDRPVSVVAIGAPETLLAEGPRLPPAAQLLRSATAEGLVGFDEQGRVVPAIADRWIVTDDGLSFIFRLRDGTWRDNSPISAQSARAALLNAIAAQRGGAMALDLAPIVDVRAMAGRVIEIRLSRQMPDLLQLLAQPELGLRQNGRGNGPMKLVEITRKQGIAVLRPIPPQERGLAQDENWAARARRVRLAALPIEPALAMFNRGDADIVLGGRIEDLPRLDALGIARGATRFDPVAGLFGLAVVRAEGFLSLPENREAIAMAIDRDGIANALNLEGWTATNRVVNPGLAGDDGTIAERWLGRSMAERRAIASARVAQWRKTRAAPKILRIAMPAGPGAEALFSRLRTDLGAIGLETRRVASLDTADLRLVDSVASYARAPWFLHQLNCAAVRGPCSPDADRIAARAEAEPDPTKSADLLAQAEAELTKANTFIPLGVPIRWSLVGGRADGVAPNRWNAHPLMAIALPAR